MKFKSLTKLALSGVALAAVAATLGTSTYAWYVANSTASVTGLSGATAESNSGNLLLAQVKSGTAAGSIEETGNWGNTLDKVTYKSSVNLNPVSEDAEGLTPTGTNVTATGWHNRDLEPIAAASAYNYYAFGIMSTEMTTVNMTLGIENTTDSDDYNTQVCYSTSGTGSIGVNNSFYVDLVKALRVRVFLSTLESATVTTATASTALKGTYNTNGFMDKNLSSTYSAVNDAPSGVTALTGGNAHTYYEAVAGEEAAAGFTEITGSTLTNGLVSLTVTKNVKYVLYFMTWIEGTDTDCFDSIGGQSYNIVAGFEAVSNS